MKQNCKMLMSLWSLVVLFCSCDHKDLIKEGLVGTLQITFDWQRAPKAQPKGMTVLFYNLDNLTLDPIRYDFPDVEGGSVQLPCGNYQAVAYNYDTEAILYRGMSVAADLEAYTRNSSLEEGTQISTVPPCPQVSGEEPVVLEPDPLWSAASSRLTVGADGQTVIMLPEQRFQDITVTIHNVPNLKYTNQLGGALSGLASSVWMQAGQIGDRCVTQAFTVSAVDASTLQMNLRVFGHCANAGKGIYNTHLLTIYAVLADNTKWYYTQDITEKMHDARAAPDDTHIYIELDELPLPKPIVNGSGFQPTIDGWQGIEINVGM